MKDKLILATDFDGTLCIHGKISEHTMSAIKEFRKAGNLFGVVTGRCYRDAYPMLTNIKVPFDYILCDSGATAVDEDGEIIFSEKCDGKILPDIFDAISSLTYRHMGLCVGKIKYDFKYTHPDGDEEKHYSPVSILKETKEFNMVNTICDGPNHAKLVTKMLKEKFGEYLNPLQNYDCIDIPPAGCDKGTGLYKYASMMGVKEENIWTAGDNYNDMAMIERFNGCAVSNAVPELKKMAKMGEFAEVGDILDKMMAL